MPQSTNNYPTKCVGAINKKPNYWARPVVRFFKDNYLAEFEGNSGKIYSQSCFIFY